MSATSNIWLRPGFRRRGRTGRRFRDSGPEQLPGLDAARAQEIAGGGLLAVPELGAQHLDAPALGGHLEACRAAFDDLADLALDGTEGPDRQLAAVEDLQFRPVQGGPGARGRSGGPDQVVDYIDLIR